MLYNIIPKDIYPIVIDYAKILVPSLITFFLTRFAFTRERKYAIWEKQFNQVYLPLYLITKQYVMENSKQSIDNMPLYIKKVNKLFYSNYQYVYPKTLKLFEKLKNEKTQDNLSIFVYQVSFDYESLKGSLGYPTKSLINIFHRLTPLDRAIYVTLLLITIFDVLLLANFFYLFFNRTYIDAFLDLITFGFTSLILYIFHYIAKH